jgi:hypothetical protein
LNTGRFFDLVKKEIEIAALSVDIADSLRTGKDVVFHSPNALLALDTPSRIGLAYSVTKTEVSPPATINRFCPAASRTRADTSERASNISREISAAACARLGADGMRVWKEIQPGLPSCVSLNDPRGLLV